MNEFPSPSSCGSLIDKNKDKPDLVDRNRQVGVGADNSRKGMHRELRKPGEYWEYNDVRVNRFSLSLLQVFREPLAEVLRQRIMAPIGASDGSRPGAGVPGSRR